MFKKFLTVAVVATGMTFISGADAEARPFIARRVLAPVRTVAPVRRAVAAPVRVVAPVRRVAAPVTRAVVAPVLRPAVVAPVVRPVVRPYYPVYGGAAVYGGAYYTPGVSVSVGF